MHGRSYFGTQLLGPVVVVHVGGRTGTGGGHSSPLAQGAAPAEVEHVEYVSAWHTIPVAQSLSVVQGAGWHDEIVCGVQVTTGVEHTSPGAQAGCPGHPEMPETWQVKPFEQSLSWEHVGASARTAAGMTSAPTASHVASGNRSE